MSSRNTTPALTLKHGSSVSIACLPVPKPLGLIQAIAVVTRGALTPTGAIDPLQKVALRRRAWSKSRQTCSSAVDVSSGVPKPLLRNLRISKVEV